MRYLCLFALLSASLAYAQLTPTVDPYGGLPTIMSGDHLLGQNLHVTLVKPKWSGNLGNQAEGGGLTVTETADGAVRVFRGEFSAEGKPIAYEQRLEIKPNETVVRWKLVPSAELEAEAIVVFVELPVAGNAGQGSFLISDGDIAEEKPLPAELPTPYHLGGAAQASWFAWRLPGGVGLQMIPDGKGITGVSFQDNRQFGADVFQAHFQVAGSFGLRANQPYEFGLTLRPFDEAAYQAERQRVVDLATALEVPLNSAKPLALRNVKLSAARVPAYGKLELTLDLDATWENPFDPADIDVMATFTGPGGKSIQVPGFFYQPYTWFGKQIGRRLRTNGPPVWQVRFAPPQPGAWTARIAVRDRSGTVESKPVRFQCTVPTGAGFVRRAPATPYYLQTDSGKPFFPIGENICWDSGGNVDRYPVWFKSLREAGGNYCRIWLVRWNMGLEWMPGKASGTYYGLGKYALDNAWKLDWVMEQARRNGIYCMLCLGYHGELMDQKAFFGENCWEDNPYAQVNGGPCAKPADFWTNEQARKLYQQRLRYYVARYGWDDHVMSWELWNEVNAPAPWVKEMAGYLRANDPSKHLVTTTYGGKDVWDLEEMDYTQEHSYGSDENRPRTAQAIADQTLRMTTAYRKPYQCGEFGIDFKTGDNTHDPKGLGTSLHDGLWASVMTRSLGTAAIWYWDGYVHPLNMYHEYTSIARFIAGTPWNKWSPDLAQFDRPILPVKPDTPWADVKFQPGQHWSKQSDTEVIINGDGTIGGAGNCSQLLFSASKPDLQSPARFKVAYPAASKLILHVGQVSQGALLHVLVDGQEVWTQDLPCAEGEGPWKKAVYSEQWKIWQNVYDQDYEVAIPAGEHVIEVTNTGKDWANVGSYTFVGVRDPHYAAVDQYGLSDGKLAMLWLHDQESNWYNDKYNKPPQPIKDLKTALRGLPDGNYKVEWWDTRQGKLLSTQTLRSKNQVLPLTPPEFTRDIAAKIRAVP